MIKNIYVHSSKYENIREFKEDKDFESVVHYPKEECEKAHPNEYGLIRHNNLRIHLFLGHIRQEKCPWCMSEVEYTQMHYNKLMTYSCLRCVSCGSQGPVSCLRSNFFHDETILEETKVMLKAKYSMIKQWDDQINV